MGRFITFLLLIFLTIPAIGQNVDNCHCDQILLNGVVRYRSEESSSNVLSIAKTYVVQTDYEKFIEEQKSGVGANYGFIGLSVNMSKTEYMEKQKQFVSENSSYSTKIETKSLIDKYGDPLVIKAWTDCRLNCETGILKHGFLIHDETAIEFFIVYKHGDGKLPNINSFVIYGGHMLGRTDNKIVDDNSELLGGSSRYPIKRDSSNSPIQIIFKSAGKDFIEYIPKYIEPCNKCRDTTLIKVVPETVQIDGKLNSGGYTQVTNGLAVSSLSTDNTQENFQFWFNVPKTADYKMEIFGASPVDVGINITIGQSDSDCKEQPNFTFPKTGPDYSEKSLKWVPYTLPFTLSQNNRYDLCIFLFKNQEHLKHLMSIKQIRLTEITH